MLEKRIENRTIVAFIESSSHELLSFRLNSNTALHDLDDATIISELEAQGEEVMRQWSSLLSTTHMQEEANTANNNSVNSGTGNNNNQATTESGYVFAFFAILCSLATLDYKTHGARRFLGIVVNETLPRVEVAARDVVLANDM